MAIDQEAYHILISGATEYLTHLTAALGDSFDELQSQDVETEDLANALDAIIFANQKLQEQKGKLDAYREKLRSDITSKYGEETK